MEIKHILLSELKAYEKNAMKHPEEQIEKLAGIIKEFGFKVPIIIDSNMTIIAGHGRVEAASRLGLEEVPCIIADDLSEEQIKAFRIADNKIREGASWDLELLQEELLSLEDRFDYSLLGMVEEELGEILNNVAFEEIEKDEAYTKKILSPVYEPKNEKPHPQDLYNKEKYEQLINQIESAEISEEVKEFLRLAACRHIVFNYELSADFYAHSNKKIQEFMEDSAMVIIDFGKAIENGYVRIKKEISEQYIGDAYEG